MARLFRHACAFIALILACISMPTALIGYPFMFSVPALVFAILSWEEALAWFRFFAIVFASIGLFLSILVILPLPPG
jgi:ABC-type tungstate transport system substrate-binding protein